MAFELTDAGVSIQTVDEIADEIKAQLWADINPGLNLASTSALGNVVLIFADKLREMQEMARAVYEARNPDGATGASLDRIGAFTGTEREGATKSYLTACDVNLDDGFSAAAGEMVAHVTGDPSRRFVNVTAASNSSGVPATISVDFEAEEAGPVGCLSGELEVIAEPLTGWNAITNPTDAVEGQDEESDSAYRVRRRDELVGGSHTVDAIRTDILQNADLEVVFCKVLENDTDATDANGLPPKSIMVVAYGPVSPSAADDLALATQILASKPASIKTYGTTAKTVTDDQGNDHTVKLTRPTAVPIYLEIDVTTDESFPDDGETQIKEALVAVGDDTYQPGDDVIASRLKAAAFAVTGVTDVTALRLGTAPSPVGTANLAITYLQIATLDTGDVTTTVA
jgi:uncharacterized phage protein gp47/JayE